MMHFKVCLIGASAVGKTSLVRRFVDGIFSEKYLTTIGVKIDKKVVAIEEGEAQLMVWDIEGTDQFSGFTPRFLNGAAAYVVVIDQSRVSSFEDALDVYAKARQSSNAQSYLVINKQDLPNQLTDEQLAQTTSLGFSEVVRTSAKDGQNVEQLFESITRNLLKERS
ncbi:Rab family GTPase [Thalassotalea euphylliae]|uniref:Rab family GTPase n=1 Tax=Thalassotalea euphylliae TaxID=1655234 RepID=UPI0036366277